MTMPKGFKVENGYATAAELGGKSYHQIADIMSERGFKMNHSTARNIAKLSIKHQKPVSLGISGPGMQVRQAYARIRPVSENAVNAVYKVYNEVQKIEK